MGILSRKRKQEAVDLEKGPQDDTDPLVLFARENLGQPAPLPLSPLKAIDQIRALANIVNEGHESPIQEIPPAATDPPPIGATGIMGGVVEEARFAADAADAGPAQAEQAPNEQPFDPKDPDKYREFFDKGNIAGNHATWAKGLRKAATPNRLLESDPYPCWGDELSGIPIKKDDVAAIFAKLRRIFGFQKSSMENMLDHFMTQLDSRASRSHLDLALLSLHASYIGGDDSNYRKWYFAAQLDLDEDVGFSKMKLHGKAYKRNKKTAKANNIDLKEEQHQAKIKEKLFKNSVVTLPKTDGKDEEAPSSPYSIAIFKWNKKMERLSMENLVEDVALYLLIWGEANQARFLPEFLCFVFKCARDYYRSGIWDTRNRLEATEFVFLDTIISPIYTFLRDQAYETDSNGELRKRTKDHKDIIGYDDVNQLFWYPEGIERIKVRVENSNDLKRLVDVPIQERYGCLRDLDWTGAFYKTFRETRTWMHTLTNFNRIWIIHVSLFWFFTSFNSPTLYTKDYQQLLDNPPLPQATVTVVALGGFLCCVIQIIATMAELHVVPSKWPGRPHLYRRLTWLFILAIANVGPSIFIFSKFDLLTYSRNALRIAFCQLILAFVTSVYFSVCPLSRLFRFHWLLLPKKKKKTKAKRHTSSQTFTASFARLTGRGAWFSNILWVVVFSAKFVESYFFLTLSIRDPIRVLSFTDITRCVGDVYLGTFLCRHQAHFVLGLVYLTELLLFFLDTYLWYIICNCLFSMGLSFSLGMSILTPWRNVYSRLPKRLYSKILATTEMEIKYKPKILVSQVWNAVIISMYREHLLPVDFVHKLMYHQAPAEEGAEYKSCLKSPSFFISNDDSTFKSSEFFPADSEAERRVSFFAQSMATPIPEPSGVETMPAFTVLIPHYGEKILLSLPEILRESNSNSRISLLEYLKKLYPTEWSCFVKDSILMAQYHGYDKDGPVKYDTTKKKRDMERAVFNEGDLVDETQQLDRHDTRNDEILIDNDLAFLDYPKSPETILFEDEVYKFRKSQRGLRKWFFREPRTVPPTPQAIPDGPAIEENAEISMGSSSKKNVLRGEITVSDVPYYCVGFKRAVPEFQLRTRIWASLRSQTLYRTASGFVNYAKALKLLYRIENPLMVQYYRDDDFGLNEELEAMAARKFKIIIAMQRLIKFNEKEKIDYLFLLKAFPEIRVAYLEEEPIDPEQPTGEKIYYSCLTDGYCKFDEDQNRIPKYRIKLSGNPILGDGKSDNQNHLLIFYRGEYIQVVDANQDNYLEECLKIRSVLEEFEEMDIADANPYRTDSQSVILLKDEKAPVAIVGAREYIFSENIGVLGDVAAGKEQTFGTLFARTLAEIGGKLHYGHPDFLNAIFMTTRGGISKAQRGLHLNEDIYAGMNALVRGGRIKHCDYYQCGKGRDLGFGSILNFTTKIGAGMGEQLLSREYYYLGTQLPIDRFLSFYYAHPGFHINNLFITLSVQMFMVVLLNLGALTSESILCEYNKDVPYTDLQEPIGCYMIQPVLNWVTIFIFSVFLVFFVAFLPLAIQELTERGLWRAIKRLNRHLLSLSPFFEVFVCQIYSNSLMTDVTFGGARYISTGRGFAIERVPFFYLYSRFTTSSIYAGAKMFLMILFSSISIWQVALLWFWVSLVSMCFAPVMFNPHQFSIKDFFVDYRLFLRWMYTGNGYTRKRSAVGPESWIQTTRRNRARYTGYRRNREEEKRAVVEVRRPTLHDLLVHEFVVPFLTCIATFFAYTFTNSQNGVRGVKPTNSVLRLLLLVFIPMGINMLLMFVMSVPIGFLSPLLGLFWREKKEKKKPQSDEDPDKAKDRAQKKLSRSKYFGNAVAGFAHTLAVVIHLGLFQVIWFLEGWNFRRALACLICVVSVNELIFSCLAILLTREWRDDNINSMWWTGLWYRRHIKVLTLQPFRELLCKTMEMSQFPIDFIIAHMILFAQLPFLAIPGFDKLHTLALFWMRPNAQFKRRYFATKLRKKRTRVFVTYLVVYILLICVFTLYFVGPLLHSSKLPDLSRTAKGTPYDGLIQPNGQWNDDTGANATSTIITTTGTMPVFHISDW